VNKLPIYKNKYRLYIKGNTKTKIQMIKVQVIYEHVDNFIWETLTLFFVKRQTEMSCNT